MSTTLAIRLPYTSAHPIVKAELHFTTETGLRSQREWQSLVATITAQTITAPAPTPEANTWFLTLTDDTGSTVSTEIQFQ
jgi:hypothetical protein